MSYYKTVPKKFTINRRTWARAGKGGASLLAADGMRCATGTFLLACGFKPADIRGQSSPNWAKLFPQLSFKTAAHKNALQGVISGVISINDAKESDATKEERLKAKFAEAGILVSFEG